MSDETTSYNILLPQASVEVFAADDRTVETARSLTSDWRFARITVMAEKVGIADAIERYAQYMSPDLVIIETRDISDAFVAQLEQLAANCSAGTEAIIIGPMNDVRVYRKLVGMGVRDYLVTPVSKEDLVSVIARSVTAKRGLSESRLIAVLGSKGGVGATTVTQMLSWNISHELKQKTLMIDAGGGWGNLGVSFGVEPTVTLGEAMRIAEGGSDDDMKRMLSNVDGSLFMLTAGGDSLLRDAPAAEGFEQILNRVMMTYPVVIVDLSGGAPPALRERVVSRAHDTVLVTTPTLPSLRNARSILSELRATRSGKTDGIDMIVNMVGKSSAHEVGKADIKAVLDFEPEVYVPFEPKIFIGAESGGKVLGEEKAAEPMLKGLMTLASRACAAQPEAGAKKDAGKKDGGALPFLAGMMDRLKKKSG